MEAQLFPELDKQIVSSSSHSGVTGRGELEKECYIGPFFNIVWKSSSDVYTNTQIIKHHNNNYDGIGLCMACVHGMVCFGRNQYYSVASLFALIVLKKELSDNLDVCKLIC